LVRGRSEASGLGAAEATAWMWNAIPKKSAIRMFGMQKYRVGRECWCADAKLWRNARK
jgi:hypothetical protein